MKYIVSFCYFLIAYWFYIFIFLIIFDIILGVALILKITSLKSLRNQLFHRISLSIIIALPVLIVTVGWMNYSNIKISEYNIDVPRKDSNLHQLKIAVASDIHLNELTDKNFMHRFVEKLNLQNPDILLIPGDIVEGDNQNIDAVQFENEFRQIKTKYGVFASLGNHESHGGVSTLDFFKKSNIEVLADAVSKINDSFYLIGRNDDRARNRKSLDELMNYASVNLPIIMMDHRPEGFDSVSKSRGDIQVSGHTHNGQLYPFNYVIAYLYELSWGYKKVGNTNFFVTSGIQGWGPHVRTAGISEIMIINVKFMDH
jgi:predicted MPP superfamily phosphohydrolase